MPQISEGTAAVRELELELSELGERYGRLRLINPRAERQMQRSLERYGQMSPVVVCRQGPEGYELIDGFKRLRASRESGIQRSLRARIMEVGARVAKAFLLNLNRIANTTSELEEGWVVQSLCREDGMTQVEIGVMLEHDKSWVCRRLALVEKLSDEVQEQVRLGLVSATVGRELARLPRGNQCQLLDVVHDLRLCSREVSVLVDLLLASSREQQEQILLAPVKALLQQGKSARRYREEGLSDAGTKIVRGLNDMKRACEGVSNAMCGRELDSLTPRDHEVLLERMELVKRSGELAVLMLGSAMQALRVQEERQNGVQ